MASAAAGSTAVPDRLLSLDVFRGMTMFLLIGESTHLYSYLVDPSLQGTLFHAIGTQFQHHPWNGLRFWDLIQPFFMFIVGVAIPFAVARREQLGMRRARIVRHVLFRSFLLLLLGWALYCIEPGRITFRFQNVLAQLSVTYLFAFLLMRRSLGAQLGWSFGLLAVTEIVYRLFPIPSYDQAFIPDHNFGAYVDMLISGELSSGHWVSFNAVPTAAHTIWGVVAGQCLMSVRPPRRKIMVLSASGIAMLLLGYSLNPITPIIKRIATSSFVVASGGYCLLALVFCYWLIDVRKHRGWTTFFSIVGLNSIFIYLFTESGGTSWIARLVRPFVYGLFSWAGNTSARMLAGLAAWAILWSMCYWLYRRKIVIKI
jgi:predicted acyltransferase